MIIEWTLFLFTFLIGYALGRGKLNKKTVQEVKKEVKNIFSDSRVGAIKRPTGRDMYLKDHPELKEGMDEMSKDLKQQGL